MVSARPARCLARTWHSPSVDMNPDSLTAKPALFFPQIGGAAALPYRPLKEGPVQFGETFWSLAPEEGRRWGSKAGDSTPSLQVTPLSPFHQGPALNSPPPPTPMQFVFKSVCAGTFLVVYWLRLCLLTQEMWVRSLAGELRPHRPPGQTTKTLNRSNIETNSIQS